MIAREGLVSGIGYTYEWNTYDRMTLAYNDDLDLYGGYDYDGLGRMNGRLALNLGDSRFRGDFPTWVGLNKLCEERYLGIGDGDSILRPDDESTDDPNDAGWASFLGLETQEYVGDTERGKVVHLAGDDWSGGAIFQIGDTDNDDNPYNAPWEYANGRVTMWFKNNNISEPVQFAFQCVNDMDDPIELGFMTDEGTDTGTPGVSGATFYIGSALNDGEWHYLEFDLVARMQQFGEAPEFTRVDALLGFGLALDINFDDFVIGNGLLGKSYQIIPGVATGGVIGAQCGAAGSHTDDFYTTATMPAWSKFFYNYNDLGTVVSTVDDIGTVIGVYEPDFFGNYRYVDGERPDNIGLTSKSFDHVSGYYDFGKRTLDPERGRWPSEEPSGIDGPNLYHFCFNAPSGYIDPNGLRVIPDWIQNVVIIAGAAINPVAGLVGGTINGAIRTVGPHIEAEEARRACEEARNLRDYHCNADPGGRPCKEAHDYYLWACGNQAPQKSCAEAMEFPGTSTKLPSAGPSSKPLPSRNPPTHHVPAQFPPNSPVYDPIRPSIP